MKPSRNGCLAWLNLIAVLTLGCGQYDSNLGQNNGTTGGATSLQGGVAGNSGATTSDGTAGTGGSSALPGSFVGNSGATTSGGATGTGGGSTIDPSLCEKIAGAYQVPATDVNSLSIFLHIETTATGECDASAQYAWEEGGWGTVTWQSQTAIARFSAMGFTDPHYQCCYYWGSSDLLSVTLDLDQDGRLLGTGQIEEIRWFSMASYYHWTSYSTIGPMSGSTTVTVYHPHLGPVYPWDTVEISSARRDGDLAQELVPLAVGSGQWTKYASSTARTDLGSDWDVTRGTSIPVDVYPNAVDDDGLPITAAVINVIDIGAVSKSILFTTVPPGAWKSRIASPRPTACGSSDCLYLPDYVNTADASPPARVGWQMDATGTTLFSVTCAPSCGVAVHPIPEGSAIQTLTSTKDSVTGATTNHYAYSNVSRLGIEVSGNGIYLIGAEVH